MFRITRDSHRPPRPDPDIRTPVGQTNLKESASEISNFNLCFVTYGLCHVCAGNACPDRWKPVIRRPFAVAGNAAGDDGSLRGQVGRNSLRFPAKGKRSAVPAAQCGKGNWFATPARAGEAGGCAARWAVECRAVECRRTVRRKSGTRYSTTRSAAAADLLLMLEDAEIARVAGLHSALPNF